MRKKGCGDCPSTTFIRIYKVESYLILLPVMALLWGFIGYLLFKRIWIVLMLTFVFSTIFIFTYTGFDLSNLYWFFLMTAFAFVSSGFSKVIHVHFQEKKKGKSLYDWFFIKKTESNNQ
ncbi:DUF2651 family protein [Bacillus sp. FJAT-53060]|nr:DUF2651 family protein [Bacillus stratosphericus]